MPTIETQISIKFATFLKEIEKLATDTSNSGPVLAQLFTARVIKKLVTKHEDNAIASMKEMGLIVPDLKPGTHDCASSNHVHLSAEVSEPIRAFDANELANLIQAKYRVPKQTTIEFIDKAKIPGKSRVTFKCVEV